MKPGRTANIRISPKDCMSCIDVVKKTGINLQGASFTIIVSTALSSMLESFRQNGIIPTRDGFEYAEMMHSYPKQGKADHARALAITSTFNANMPKGQVPAALPNHALARKRLRFDELAHKSNNDAENMSIQDQAELDELVKELNPL